jgi:hypothetical protein
MYCLCVSCSSVIYCCVFCIVFVLYLCVMCVTCLLYCCPTDTGYWHRILSPDTDTHSSIRGFVKTDNLGCRRTSRWTWKTWRIPPSRILRSVALARTEVSKEITASMTRVTRISELETTLVVTSKRPTLWRNVGGAKFHRNVICYKRYMA